MFLGFTFLQRAVVSASAGLFVYFNTNFNSDIGTRNSELGTIREFILVYRQRPCSTITAIRGNGNVFWSYVIMVLVVSIWHMHICNTLPFLFLVFGQAIICSVSGNNYCFGILTSGWVDNTSRVLSLGIRGSEAMCPNWTSYSIVYKLS